MRESHARCVRLDRLCIALGGLLVDQLPVEREATYGMEKELLYKQQVQEEGKTLNHEEECG